MPRVVFYDPHLAALGGGDKYLLTILEHVARVGERTIEVISPTRSDPSSWHRLGIDVDPARVQWRAASDMNAAAPLARRRELSAVATKLSEGADLFVASCAQVPPRSLARRSVVIIAFPCRDFRRVRGLRSRLWRTADRRRLRSYDDVICYSHFVQEHIVSRLGVQDALVIEPPVDVRDDVGISLYRKDRMVLAVGRFAPWLGWNHKKHDLMIDAWRRLVGFIPDGWELHLAGGLTDDRPSRSYLQSLKQRADGLPVYFHVNASLEELKRLYTDSAIFWHATGIGESDPQRFEHFGITTVEAMAHGCVPVVPALGGQLEIVDHGVTGYLWSNVDELIALTMRLIEQPAEADRMYPACIAAADRFSKERFVHRVREHVLKPAGVV